MIEVASARWRRLDVQGRDTCVLSREDNGWILNGAAEFPHEQGPARVSYRIECAIDWSTRAARFHGAVGDRRVTADIARQKGVWSLNGVDLPELGPLIDIDFGFTPATNVILMKRVSFPLDRAVALSVAWYDVGEKTLTALPQRYTRRDAHSYWYESPTADYQGLLVLASNGFVRTYPGLWEMESSS